MPVVKQTLNIVVRSRSPFVDTGMVLGPNDSLRVTANGYIRYLGFAGFFYAYAEGVYAFNNDPRPGYAPNTTATYGASGLRYRQSSFMAPGIKPFSIGVRINAASAPYPLNDVLQCNENVTFDDSDHNGGKVFLGLNTPISGGPSANGSINVKLEKIVDTSPTGPGEPLPIPDHTLSPIYFIPTPLRRIKAESTQATAWCWFIQPRSAAAEAYTSWDQPIVCPAYVNEFGLDGNFVPAMTYVPNHGVDLTSIPKAIKMGIQAPDVRVIRLPREKLLTGHYEGAYVEIFEVPVDDDRSQRWMPLVGELGNTEMEDYVAIIELTPMEEWVNRPIGARINMICDVGRLPDETFGRGRCRNMVKLDGPDIADWTRGAILTQRFSLSKYTFDPFVVGEFAGFNNTFPGSHGRLIGVTGKNTNVIRDIGTFKATTGELILRRALPLLPDIGDAFKIEAGCDRTPEMCRDLWNNQKNGRYFKNVPGRAAVMRRYRTG